jgi:hypothetical protein
MHAENPENFAAQARKFSPRSSGNRTGFSEAGGRALRAQILRSVRQHRRLAERALHGCTGGADHTITSRWPWALAWGNPSEKMPLLKKVSGSTWHASCSRPSTIAPGRSTACCHAPRPAHPAPRPFYACLLARALWCRCAAGIADLALAQAWTCGCGDLLPLLARCCWPRPGS